MPILNLVFLVALGTTFIGSLIGAWMLFDTHWKIALLLLLFGGVPLIFGGGIYALYLTRHGHPYLGWTVGGGLIAMFITMWLMPLTR